MPIDRCRQDIRIFLKANDLFQTRAAVSNDCFAVLYQCPRIAGPLIKIGSTVFT